jgi:hypothetical protein
MLFSTRSTLEAIRPFLSGALVDERGWTRVARAAGALPNAIAHHTLECRLAEGASQVDYLACGTVHAGSAPLLAQRRGWQLPAPEATASPARERVWALLSSWADRTESLARHIPLIWLELDLEDGGPEHPVPRVGVCVDPSLVDEAVRPPREFEGPLERALELLRGGPLSRSGWAMVRRSIHALPPHGRAVHFGAAPSGSAEVLRCVPELPVEDVPRYLDALGWPGDVSSMHRVFRDLHCSRDGRVKIDVDIVNGDLQPKFASFTELWHTGATMREVAGPLLERFVDFGLCSPAKAEAVCRWPGRDHVHFEGFAWPITLTRTVDLKAIVWPDGRTELKAYLAFNAQVSLF